MTGDDITHVVQHRAWIDPGHSQYWRAAGGWAGIGYWAGRGRGATLTSLRRIDTTLTLLLGRKLFKKNLKKKGGGVLQLTLLDLPHSLPDKHTELGPGAHFYPHLYPLNIGCYKKIKVLNQRLFN